jgi:hypothetical protein
MLAGGALFAGLAGLRGYQQAWHGWGIVSAGTPFLDLQVITAGAESHALGYDPLYENPRDSMQRRMNYPRAWQALFVLGLTQKHTVPLGLAIVAAFLLGIFVFARRLDRLLAAGLAVTLFSPAVMLCLERGNIDLVLFSVATLALLILPRSPGAATGVLFLGFVLKLYPILGLVSLLRENRRRFLLLTGGATVAVAVYVVWYRADLLAIREATPSPTWLSFGLMTAAQALTETLGGAPAPWLAGARVLGAGALLAVGGAMVWRVGQRTPAAEDADAAAPNLDAFRLGAGIFAGSFLLGKNFDYRLIFLLFAVPQLLEWTRGAERDRRWVSALTLGVMHIALWQQLWKPLLVPAEGAAWWSAALPTLLEQAAKCATFSGCAYLLAATAPVWLGEWFAPRAVGAGPESRRRFEPALVIALVLIVAGLALQTTRVLVDWDRAQPRGAGTDRPRAALLAQAIFSGDQARAATLRAGSGARQWNALAVGTVARLAGVTVAKAARIIFIMGSALTLASVGLLLRRRAFLWPAIGMVFAAVIWCPAFDAHTAPLLPPAFIVAGAAWATALALSGRTLRGVPRWLAWTGAAIIGAAVLAEIFTLGVAASGWLGLSLVLGGASAWLLGTRWPRIVLWPVVGLLPLLPVLANALHSGAEAPEHRADAASRGLVEALSELTPPESVCVIVGGDTLQLRLLDTNRRSRVWTVSAGGDFERQLAELAHVWVGSLIVEKGATLDPAQFAALCNRLNLDDTPTFGHPLAEVFLSRFVRESAVARLAAEPAFADVTTTAHGEGSEWPATAREVPAGAAAYAFTMITPRPVLYNLAYGYALWSAEGSAVLRAHAESEVYVPVPTGAKSIRWEFGIMPGAYQREPGTDGVEFLIEGEVPESGRREIFRRVLDPVSHEGDRGTQTETIGFTPRAGERLIFHSRPNGSSAFDWSYWRKIRVE